MYRVITPAALQRHVAPMLLTELQYVLGPYNSAGWTVQQLCNAFVPPTLYFGLQELEALMILLYETVENDGDDVINALLVPKQGFCFFFPCCSSLSLPVLLVIKTCFVTMVCAS